MHKFTGRIPFLISTCLFSSALYAGSEIPTNQNQFFPILPRITGWALGGSHWIGQGEGLVSLYGSDSSLLYTDWQGKTDTNSNWFGGGSLGFRQIYQDQRIYGVYVFVDHTSFGNQVTTSSSFWNISPGLESLGNLWDFRINGYIPVSSQNVTTGTVFGDQLGIFNGVQFTGHNQFDQLYTIENNTGPGFDGEIGRVSIPGIPRLRAYVGGYFFSPKNADSIGGGEARLEYAVNHYIALTVSDSYDNNVHNTTEAGLRLTLGGIHDDQTGNDISRRMADLIPRNLATLGVGTGVPVVTTNAKDGIALEQGNIYFFTTEGESSATSTLSTSQSNLLGASGSTFNPAQGTNNCTAENPCNSASFNQATVTSINDFAKGALFYLAPGNYSALNGTMGFFDRQSIFGRTPDYTAPAQGAERASLIGAISLPGNNLVDSVQIVNNPNNLQGVGVNLSTGANVTLDNVLIGALNATQGYPVGIAITNATLTVKNSEVNAFATGGAGVSANGIQASGGNNTLNIKQDTINVQASGLAVINAIGINAISNRNNLFMNNTVINATASSNSPVAGLGSSAIGIQLQNTRNNVVMRNDIINPNAVDTGIGAAGSQGMVMAGTSFVDMSLTSINAIANSLGVSGDAQAFGINSVGTSVVNIANSNINTFFALGSTTGSEVTQAIALTGPTNILTVNDSQLSATGRAGVVANIQANAISVTSSAGDSTVNVNNSSLFAIGTAATSGNILAETINATSTANNTLNINNASLSATAQTGAGTATAHDIDLTAPTANNYHITLNGLTLYTTAIGTVTDHAPIVTN